MTDVASLGMEIRSEQVKQANDELGKFAGAAKRAEDAAKGFGTNGTNAAKQVAAANDNATRSATVMANAYARLAAIIGTVLGTALSALGLKAFIDATSAADKVTAQLGAALKSTGGAAGQTLDSLNAHASALQKITTFGDDTVKGAQALLLTFTKIQGEVFPQATTAALDLATAMKMDLNSAAMLVGKALNDPVLGMTALTRSGIQFTQAQKDAVKQMVETGNVAGAQAVILKELETQFGGSAVAARQTLGGALTSLREAWGDLFELGGDASNPLRMAIEGLITAITNPAFVSFIQTIGAALFGAATIAIQGITALVNGISVLADNMDTIGVAVGTAGGLLLAYFAPTILAGIAAGLVTVGAAGVAAIRGITAAMAANPLGALLVGITAAVTALYYFRDEVQKALGVDVVQVAKTAANFIINSFVVAYEDIKFIWTNFPTIIGAAVIGAANATIKGVQAMINGVSELLNSFIDSANTGLSKIPGSPQIGRISPVSFGGIENPYADKLASAQAERSANIAGIMSTDRFGGAKKEFESATPAAQNFARAVDDANKKLDETGGKGGAGSRAAKAVKEVADAAQAAAQKVGEFLKDIVTGFVTDMRSGLSQGKSFFESFGKAAINVLNKIADKLLSNVLDKLISNVTSTSGGTSLLNSIGSLFGFASGGYTGNGPRHAAAGVVHGQEYVFSAAATRKIGVGNLDAMHRRAKGYAEGGFVSPAPMQDNRPREGGGMTFAPSYTIDARNSSMSESEFRAILQANNEANFETMKRNLPQIFMAQQRRFS